MERKSIVTIETRELPRVPEGIYNLKYLYYETTVRFGPKVVLWFEVVDENEYYGTRLARYYNILGFNGPQGRGGGFRVGPMSAFVREYIQVFEEDYDDADEDITPNEYKYRIVKGIVRTVTHGANRRPIPDSLQYSTISELIELNESTDFDEGDDDYNLDDEEDDYN